MVLGAGIIGLAVARELRRRAPTSTILVLEKEPAEARHSSGRNSGVVHAGFYYSPDSLKARFTAEGNRRIRQFCREEGIAVNACAKVVVAKEDSDLPGLEELAKRGALAGAGTRLIDVNELASIEPNARTVERALYSPETVTVNPREVCGKLRARLEQEGVKFEFNCGFDKRFSQNAILAGNRLFEFGHAVNTCGLYADKVARGFGFSENYTILPFKGIYLVNESGTRNTRTNIYPVPNLKNPFLGVHFTLTADGKEKIGPTAIPAFWRENYEGLSGFDTRELAAITMLEARLLLGNHFRFRDLARAELRKYAKSNLLRDAAGLVKELRGSKWTWGVPGIRAQLIDLRDLSLVQDFLVEGDKTSTHVLNAISPAFTSAFPFAEYVAEKVLPR